MNRFTALAALAACLVALPAAAQTRNATPELTRATNALAHLWRPLDGALTRESVAAACAGAAQEITAVDAAMPPVLNAASLARVRGLRGLIVIPTGQAPGEALFFPPIGVAWFTSGVGAISVISESEGFLGVRDAGGHDIAFQIGSAGAHPVARIRPPGGAVQTWIGCEPIAALDPPAG